MKSTDFPKRIEIEPTNHCNSKCIYCPRKFGIGEKGFMGLDLYKKIIDEAAEYPETVLQLFRWGESLLHPEFSEMLKYVRGKFKEVQLATNAILLDKKMSEIIAETVTFLSFSIDLEEAYRTRRGVDAYHAVEENIINFLKHNEKTTTQISMVRNNSTDGKDAEKFKKLWMDKIDRVRIYEEHSIGGRYGATRFKREKRAPCVKPFTDIVIYWNGKTRRCNHDWSNKPLGCMSDNTLSEIWKSAEFEKIREEQLSLRFTDEICKNCDSWYPGEGAQGTGYLYEEKLGVK